ncbi:hypothetical protein [Vampirovibrio sp.]|uniref:hypothetical protein n=1 Tax=Vampirovibrio sp. TaxID=2717857 RepID=UPI003594173B
MQSAFMNPQPYGNPMPLALSQYQPLGATSSLNAPTMAHPGMTQLPSMPRPLFTQPMSQPAQAFPTLPTPDQFLSANSGMSDHPALSASGLNNSLNNGSLAGIGAALPSPQQLAPGLYQPANAAYQTAASIPVGVIPNLAEVPSPYMVAPWLYLAKPAAPQLPPAAPLYPPMYPPNPAASMQPQQPPMQAPVQQKGPQQPPAPPVPPAPPPQQPPAQPPATQPKGPTTPLDDGGLTDTQIQSLNDRLNSDSEDTRADAAMELFKILDKDPTLSTRAPYNQYVNAFMEKIMKDPSAVVRTAGELAMQTGRVKQPSEGLKNQITVLNKNPGGLSGEGGVISSLMGSIKNNTLGQGFSELPGAMTTIPGSEEAAALQRQATNPAAPAAPGVAPNTPNAAPPNPYAGTANPNNGPAQPNPAMGTAPTPTEYGQQPAAAAALPTANPYGGFNPAGAQPAYPNPYGMGQAGMPAAAGQRLNYLSQAQPQQPEAMMRQQGQPGLPPQAGQRLNIQEGYR